MKSQILKISQISSDQSVICILGSDILPENLELTDKEKEFVHKQLKAKEEYIYINSYTKCTYLVRIKEDIPHYKVREELRKTAYKLRKLIKRNNHSELVITSDKAYNGAELDFAEGLLLSFYSFDKYKTKAEEEDNKFILQNFFCTAI